MTRTTIGFKLADNPEAWKRPCFRLVGTSFVKDWGYGAEDWNFATDQAIDGWVYGFTQAVPRDELRDGQAFDLLFYVYEKGVGYRAVGLYMGARYIEADEAEDLVATEAWQALRERRKREIKHAFGPGRWKRVWSNYKAIAAPFNWKARADAVVELPDRPLFTPPYRATRDGTPYYFKGATWQELLKMSLPAPNEGATTVEGRVRLVTHRQRERDPGRAARIKQARNKRDGKLACDACGWDFGARYEPDLSDLLEAHHTQPLGDLDHIGEAVRDKDIALLCPNCHRLAHRTGHTDLPSLKAFLARHGSSP